MWLDRLFGSSNAAAKSKAELPSVKVINAGESFQINKPREVVLNAALAAGLGFPHNCRVGSCTQCKCKLVKGKVRELTDTSYVLSAEDLKQGMILACQSVPESDLEIEVQLGASGNKLVDTWGVISAIKAMTHDILEVVIKTDEPLAYTSGQYAQLNLMEYSAARNYSFANPSKGQASDELRFFIRHVPGGRFTDWLFEADRTGSRLAVAGPFGDFHLRHSDASMVCVAGGSGLAPVLSVLEQAAWAGVTRDAYLYFGARTQHDLYAQEVLDQLQQRWRGNLEVSYVLSHEPAESDWTGDRGWVSDAAAGAPVDWSTAQVYLCGPPPMIDATVALVAQQGVTEDRVFADRFLDSSHTQG